MALQYEILGSNLQAIQFTLQPQQTVIGEGGSMMCMDDGMSFECRLGNGSTMPQEQGWWSAMKAGFQRVVSNESLFYTWFTNNTGAPRVLMLAAPKMGTIIHLNLRDFPEGTLIAQSGAFLCSSPGVRFSVELVKKFGAGLFGGEGFILQRLAAESGSAGELFIHGGGTIVRKELNNETLTIETGCLMAFTLGIEYDIAQPGFRNAIIGGNLFVTTLRGTGSVWLQSTPDSKMIDLIIAAVPRKSDN
mmetsp:Transcript_16862/g.22698  ORF Transcript_16862/g.22698 Transcript_16862/m.22698 type:complete len:247 (-) Transcript_16862:115-855(-)